MIKLLLFIMQLIELLLITTGMCMSLQQSKSSGWMCKWLIIGVNTIQNGHHSLTTLANTKIANTSSIIFIYTELKLFVVVVESHPNT